MKPRIGSIVVIKTQSEHYDPGVIHNFNAGSLGIIDNIYVSDKMFYGIIGSHIDSAPLFQWALRNDFEVIDHIEEE